MIKKRYLVIESIAFIILLIFSISLIVVTNSIKSKNDYLQDNIDHIFSYNFSKAQENLLYEQGYESSAEENAYVCVSLFQYTTYAENDSLGQIVSILCDIENFENIKEGAEKGTEVVDTLGKLALDLKNEELAEDALTSILACM